MPRFIALLRAINVGGHTVKMDRLRGLFEALGYANVETFIASGNVIFETNQVDSQLLEAEIEGHLKQELGYEVTTFLRTPTELRVATEVVPFPDEDLEGKALSVAFVKTPPTAEAWEKLLSLRTEIDDFAQNGREIYWLCRTRVSESRFSGALFERTIRQPATVRNITTVRKLAAKYLAD